jgi:hypothetical protein
MDMADAPRNSTSLRKASMEFGDKSLVDGVQKLSFPVRHRGALVPLDPSRSHSRD